MTDVGQVVTLNMRNGKCIQGRIKSVDMDKRVVLVERPFLYGLFFFSFFLSPSLSIEICLGSLIMGESDLII